MGTATATKDAEFDVFVRDRGVALRRYAYLLTGSDADAADLLQQSLVKL